MRAQLPLLFAIAVACTPDITQSPGPAAHVIVRFDPGAATPVVPTPNDLAKDATTQKIVVPSLPTDSPAQTEFNRNYLGLLDAFPFESVAQATTTGPLEPASVNAQTVLAFDTADGTPAMVEPIFANDAISIPPPAGGWSRGKRYAIALLGGPNGLRGAGNTDVLGSETWTLVSNKSSLVTCADLKTNCAPTVDVIPSGFTDPAARLADQTTKALQLEQLRRGYAPALDALEGKGIPRSRVVLLWTFSIVDAGEVTFDPAGGIIPFPNDAVRNTTVTLPHPVTGKPLTADDCAGTDASVRLVCGLNTLDGFSTFAPLISENSATLGPAVQATLDGASLTTANVGLVRLTGNAPAGLETTPKWTPCLNCAGTTTSPQQLQWSLSAPLDERTTYVGYVTTDVKDDRGKSVIPNPAFALLRSTQPLVDAGGKSTVNVLTDAQATALEPLRVAFKPAFDALEAGGITRTSLALAFPFTTQSESTLLESLAAYPSSPSLAAIPDAPIALVDATARYAAAMDAAGAPRNAVGNIYEGAFLTPVAVTGQSGTLDVAHPSPQPVPFVLMLPKTATPSAGVTIFGHGFTRSRADVIAIANVVAQTGQAIIATDVLDHGDRSSCTGSKTATGQASDDAACATPATMRCDEDALIGLCVLRNDAARATCAKGPTGDGTCAAAGQGRCATDGKCQGAGADLLRDATGRASISGWNIISLTNFFATRDNFRQQVIDLSKLVQVLKNKGAGSLGARITALHATDALDVSRVNYVGQSLGGILGALWTSVSPDVSHVVLNVPGGALPRIILEAPAFATQKGALLAALAAEGIMPGTPAFDQFIGSAQWILDAADPASVGYRLAHGSATRKVFLQFIQGDEVVPNVSNLALVAAANRSFVPAPPSFGCAAPLACYEFTESGDDFDAVTATPATRHGFLLSPPSGSHGVPLTLFAQVQAATFLAKGSLQ